MTDQSLTVEEALRGWLNGETLQVRHADQNRFALHGWGNLPPISGLKSIRIDTRQFHYRRKPKKLEAWAVVNRDNWPVTIFNEEGLAEDYVKRHPWARVVRMVEQPE